METVCVIPPLNDKLAGSQMARTFTQEGTSLILSSQMYEPSFTISQETVPADVPTLGHRKTGDTPLPPAADAAASQRNEDPHSEQEKGHVERTQGRENHSLCDQHLLLYFVDECSM